MLEIEAKNFTNQRRLASREKLLRACIHLGGARMSIRRSTGKDVFPMAMTRLSEFGVFLGKLNDCLSAYAK